MDHGNCCFCKPAHSKKDSHFIPPTDQTKQIVLARLRKHRRPGCDLFSPDILRIEGGKKTSNCIKLTAAALPDLTVCGCRQGRFRQKQPVQIRFGNAGKAAVKVAAAHDPETISVDDVFTGKPLKPVRKLVVDLLQRRTESLKILIGEKNAETWCEVMVLRNGIVITEALRAFADQADGKTRSKPRIQLIRCFQNPAAKGIVVRFC